MNKNVGLEFEDEEASEFELGNDSLEELVVFEIYVPTEHFLNKVDHSGDSHDFAIAFGVIVLVNRGVFHVKILELLEVLILKVLEMLGVDVQGEQQYDDLPVQIPASEFVEVKNL